MNLPDKTYCRLCAKLKPVEKLVNFAPNDDNKYCEKLLRINAPIDTLEDKLPKTVCIVCLSLLEQAFEFVVQVGKAQEVLKDIFLKETMKNEMVANCYENEDFSSVTEVIKGDNVIINISAIKIEDNIDMSITPNCSTWLDYSWLCSICDTQFTNLKSLLEHSISYHRVCNPYRCIDCRKRIFSIDRFIKHVSTHRKYLKKSCYVCSKTFKDNSSCNNHKKNHFNASFSCKGCNESFKSEEDQKNHQDKFLSTRIVRIVPDYLKSSGLTCNLCGMIAKSKGSLVNHLLKHTNRTRNHICEVCGKACLRKYDLDIHLLTHSNVRSYQCNICNAKFKTDYSLREHYSSHDDVKPYACKLCNKQFRLQKQLNFHQVVHSDTYPFNCEVCGKGFRYKNKLKVHNRQHTGVMPYSCENCNRNFRDWSNYSKHMKCVHNTDISKRRKTIIAKGPEESKDIKKLKRLKNTEEDN